MQNLRRNRNIGFVIGELTPGDERTVQYNGVSDEPSGAELERLKELYFSRLPDGRERQTWRGFLYGARAAALDSIQRLQSSSARIVEFTASQLERT